jgi:hypothetical protein
LSSLYLDSVGVSTTKEIRRLFRWEKNATKKALEDLVAESSIFPLSEDQWASSGLLA